jgi:hypothetical protein
LARAALAGLIALAAVTACGSGSKPAATPSTAAPSSLPASGPTSTSASTSTSVATGQPATTIPATATVPTTAAVATTALRTTTSIVAKSSVAASAASGGLTVTLTASPARGAPGQRVAFVVSAYEAQAHGALGYHLAYGDGTSDQIAVPLYCLGGSGSPQAQTWRLTHGYSTAGSYTASVTVTANCTPDHATTQVTITVSPA